MTPVKQYSGQGYEFGSFRLFPAEHRLVRQGEPVLLPPKEFELLLLLVRNSGQVMERESLIKSLWPNTVVEEANLNVHISALRKVLAESQGEQRYIETIPRLGYRFIAEVTEVNEVAPVSAETFSLPLADEVTPSNLQVEALPGELPQLLNTTPSTPRVRLLQSSWPLWLLVLTVLGLAGLALVKMNRPKSVSREPNADLNVLPLTTYPGREVQPAFSPDGNQVAFVWRGEKDNNANLFVRLVDGGNWVQVTNHAGDDVSPAWSPDGRTIAFYRSTSERVNDIKN